MSQKSRVRSPHGAGVLEFECGGVAHSVERSVRNRQAQGSKPCSSIFFVYKSGTIRHAGMAKWQGNRFVSGRSGVRSPLPAFFFVFGKNLRQPGVEPGAKAWEASMLPIHHWRPTKGNAPCGDRTRDFWLIRPTLYQLS